MFVPLNSTHYPLLLHWLQQAHVKQWWDDGDDTLEKVQQHYFVDAEPPTRYFFMLASKTSGEIHPAGYFQYYWETDTVLGIDQFLSDTDSLNQGVGTKAVAAFVHFLVDQYQPTSIIVDPEIGNLRAIACYKKVGFRYDKSLSESAEQEVHMMRLLI